MTTAVPERAPVRSEHHVVDLSSVGYLGLRHSADELEPWDRLSTGRPASLDEPSPLANAIARLQGCEAGVLARSTLHVFWDLLGALAEDEVEIYVDEGTYHIAQWGIERGAARGSAVWPFPHHDAEALQELVTRNAAQKRRPVVILDGISSRMWTPAPIEEYLISIQPFGGLLVIDDTQATGLIGHSPGPQTPFGSGGGGSLPWHGVESPNVLLVSSLSKGFGVPVAFLSGSEEIVGWFTSKSQTLIHCSPPSVPELHAVEHALRINAQEGDTIRSRLAGNIARMQAILSEAGVAPKGPLFPVQVVPLPIGADPVLFESRLRARGVRAQLQQRADGGINIMLIITAAHRPEDIDFAADVLLETLDEFDGDGGIGPSLGK